MAVRNDFTAGEVLAAADLNDTFASKLPYSYGTATPSTTDSGFLWYDSNSTPPVPKYWNGSSFANLVIGGLNLVDSDSFTTVSSVSVNGCFTSSYTNYRILVMGVGSENNAIGMRLRASGTDASGSNYSLANLTGDGSSASSGSATATSFQSIAQMSTTMFILDCLVGRPNLASTTFLASFGGRQNYLEVRTGAHTVSTAYDGFTLIVGGGTFTGNYYVYGYSE